MTIKLKHKINIKGKVAFSHTGSGPGEEVVWGETKWTLTQFQLDAGVSWINGTELNVPLFAMGGGEWYIDVTDYSTGVGPEPITDIEVDMVTASTSGWPGEIIININTTMGYKSANVSAVPDGSGVDVGGGKKKYTVTIPHNNALGKLNRLYLNNPNTKHEYSITDIRFV